MSGPRHASAFSDAWPQCLISLHPAVVPALRKAGASAGVGKAKEDATATSVTTSGSTALLASSRAEEPAANAGDRDVSCGTAQRLRLRL
ncbi:hypothetical protein BHE74_00027203 [Ensete ventricosum]|nr:hypothetical protein GW17_00038199 [Ensete ventricosum]RWW65493.1 hypothetical protein BHE74_00027203 [Ensete ventricosum]RZR81850.1 hypothetical protein BHM03_00008154 [Ensete ventricosum]